MSDQTTIAIVGIGGVFPGAQNLDEFWQNILNARDTAIDVPVERWHLEPDSIYARQAKLDKVTSRRACLIQNFDFDPTGLDIDPVLLNQLDPLYQLLLHAGRDAWSNTRTAQLDKARVGVAIGNIVLPTKLASSFSDALFKSLCEQQLFNQTTQKTSAIEPLNCHVAGLPSGLLANALGLGNGNYTLDAACASSLYSLKYAVDELLAYRSDAMLVGGIAYPDCLYTQMGFSQLNALSTSGRCAPFDETADGLVVGEGAGIFVLKRLCDALAQDDYIYATIAGVGLSNDIAGNIMSPDSSGQLQAMQTAYAAAGWLPNQVQYIECHGTGTPVGDAVEFNSLNRLWQHYQVTGKCVIGSVKSNVGHLLTAAGAAALMKVLLAMKHGILPPTANYKTAAAKIDLANSPFTILNKPAPWTVTDNAPKRAAISGFGFGGINAHVLLQEYVAAAVVSPQRPPAPIRQKKNTTPIAIVGMDTQFGPWRDQKTFDDSVIFGADSAAKKTDDHWGITDNNHHTYAIDAIKIPLARYAIPPAELKEMLPQQLLMLEVAANALADAQLAELLPAQQHRTGIFIGIGLDLNTTNFHYRWMQQKYAKEWLADLAITLNQEAFNAWLTALKTACGPGLNANRTMGALGGIVASRIARTFQIGGPAFTISAEENSGLHALRLGIRALQQQDLDQVIIGAVDFACDPRAIKSYTADQQKSIIADAATALILKRQADAIRDNNTIYSLVTGIGAASAGDGDQSIAKEIAITKACTDAGCQPHAIDYIYHATPYDTLNIQKLATTPSGYFPLGYSGAANSLINLTAAARLLYRQLLPPGPNLKPRYWLKDRVAGPRTILIDSSGIDGQTINVILQQADKKLLTRPAGSKLFIINAESKLSLIEKINTLSFSSNTIQTKPQGQYRAALIADNEQFNSVCDEIMNAIRHDVSMQGKQCFYLPAQPTALKKIAFVYPGSGNHFFGMGQELGLAFPKILEALDQETKTLSAQFAQGRLWQNHGSLSCQEMILSQVWLGTFISDIVTSFNIKPHAVIGYSLGETTGLFATRTWTARDDMLKRIQASTLFTEDLANTCNSVKRFWNTQQPIDWAVGIISCDADTINTVLKQYPHVYLLIINTPKECVIGGDRAELNTLVSTIKARYYPLPDGITTVHCEVAKPVAEAYRKLHLFKTTPPKAINFYSGIRGGRYQVTQRSAADSILGQAVAQFDYTKVINNAYKDGVRLFIEMGPGESCTRMIDQILADKPHYAKAICVKGQDSINNLLQILAQLYVLGMPVDFSRLSEEQPAVSQKKYLDQLITIKTKRPVFNVPAPPIPAQENDPVRLTQDVLSQNITEPLSQSHLTPPTTNASPSAANHFQTIMQQMQATESSQAAAQAVFLKVSHGMTTTMSQAVAMQLALLNKNKHYTETKKETTDYCLFNRAQCLEFATGSISSVLGQDFADIENYPTRVRLPDVPLMFVDRILAINGEANILTQNPSGSGSIITEHDILANAWYLSTDRIPICIAVEAGQADLFLSSYLGIDHLTKGLAVYRLLDARITFHDHLPAAGNTIRYTINIENFFTQGTTRLFRFNFTATVNGVKLLTMTQGCAGFFTQQELAAGKGIVATAINRQQRHSKPWQALVPMQLDSYSDKELAALRKGDLAACFGSDFANINLTHPVGLPSGRMNLVHRIIELVPNGGSFGLGKIIGEADIHANAWFLTCHFTDDNVMPGTLMYECCLHTLRVYLLRMGWVGESGQFCYEPIIGQASELKCRGQVTEKTQAVQYEVILKEIGYQDDGTPYVLADALMYADHRPIVEIKTMSLQLTGLKRETLEAIWHNKKATTSVLFDNESILAFATGKPSVAFGDRYLAFDSQRKIARLPGPPYKFLDRITVIENCEQWVLTAGGNITAEYDVPDNAWYFKENNQSLMPFAILLEVALQPCGWLAAYLGSALTSDIDLSFRNLGGKATQYINVPATIGTLTTTVKITNVAQSGGMIIENFDYAVHANQGLVYKGNTYFGFFSKPALDNQIGLQNVQPFTPSKLQREQAEILPYPTHYPMPAAMMCMVDDITCYDPKGGANGLGFIEGVTKVNAAAWFFKAHFYQDPVWPGSLGLESFIQLLKFFAWKRWPAASATQPYTFESMALNQQHEWVYRGQILPQDKQVKIQAEITAIYDKCIIADGLLAIDNRIIYQMKDFALRMT